MSENCTHDCSTCGESCASRTGEQTDFSAKLNPLSHVKKVIAVMSGKGGVGKSLVTSMLAVLAKREGFSTAIMDADITGPSIPKGFGLTEKAEASTDGLFPVMSKSNIEIMSLNLLLDNDTDPVVWRGPVIAGAVQQFWTDVIWGDVDYMFVDMPPGTGDVPLTVFQSLPVDGIVVVSSPQELVGMIVEKAVNMAAMMNIPVLALVENMSYFKCPDCGGVHNIFGESNIEVIAEKHGIDTVCRLPMDPAFALAADNGQLELVDADALKPVLERIK